MRIITWNCPGKTTDRALDFLKDYDADIIVLQECSRPLEDRPNHIWIGNNLKKGLAVVAKPEYKLTCHPIAGEAGPFFCPVQVDGPASFHLLAIWSHRNHKYIEGIIDAVDIYHDFLSQRDAVVTGDFNSNAIWDKGKHGKKNYSALAKRLNERYNLASAYHAFHTETPGQETKPTFHMYKREDKPYHIDYCFAPKSWCERITKVEVGVYKDWIKFSDHAPLVIDFG